MFRTAIRKLGKYLIDLSNPRDEPVGRAPQTRGPTISSDNFERRTRQLGETRKAAAKDGAPAAIVAGSIQFVGMHDIKCRLGAAWHSVAGIAHVIAEDSIRSQLTGTDAFRRHDEETFILTFESADKAQAEEKTRAIIAEIHKRLAEQVPDAKLCVDHAVSEIEWVTVESGSESIIDTIAATLRKVREEAAIAAASWRRQFVQNAVIRYSPVWTPAKRVVMSYRVLLDSESGKQALQRLSAVCNPEELKLALFELDCVMIGRAVAALHKLLDRGGKAQLLVPVHVSTFDDRPRREQYIKLCDDVPQPYKKLILFHLHGVASGMPEAPLMAIGRALRPHGQGVFLEVPANSNRPFDFTAASFHGIAINAKSLPSSVPEATHRLARLAAAARTAGLKVYIHGADTTGLVEAAAGAQVDRIEGRAIALPGNDPKTAYQWVARGIG